jgi:hypothetical protein
MGVVRPQREDDHSFPSSAEVKNQWSYASIFFPSIRRSVGTIYEFVLMKQRKHKEALALWSDRDCKSGPPECNMRV